MRSFPLYLNARGGLRFIGAPEDALRDLSGAGPVYVHARNWIAEMAAIQPLRGLVVDELNESALFPEEGLALALGEVLAVHGVSIEYQGTQALALEFATLGEPRTLSVAAIPGISDMDHFARLLCRQPSEIMDPSEYQAWREDFTIRPVMCPCCQDAIQERRSHPERNPLTMILRLAIEDGLELRCEIVSPVVGFCTWMKPCQLRLSGGLLELTGHDKKSLLEIDPGMCHCLRIGQRVLDGEVFSEMTLHDSLGQPHLRISARGKDHERLWRGICG